MGNIQIIASAFDTDKPLLDLAVEVNYTSGSVIDLDKYKDLGIKEVWIWKDEAITFYHLLNSQYQEVENSVCLPQLTPEFLITFINRGLTETPLTIERGRCRWLVGISNRAVEEDFYQQLN